MNFKFFRGPKPEHEMDSDWFEHDPAVSITDLDEPASDNLGWPMEVSIVDEATQPDADPVTKAQFGCIALVTVEQEPTNLPVLLDDATRSRLMQRVTLPLNPRIATHELYEFDSADLIMIVAGTGLNRAIVRWLRRLQPMGVPILILTQQMPQQPVQRQKIAQFSQRTGVPIVPITSDKVEESLHSLIVSMLDVAPAMAAVMAGKLDAFRPLYVSQVLQSSTQASLKTDANAQWGLQMQLVRQLSVAYGCSGKTLKLAQPGLETMMKLVTSYTPIFAKRFPIADPERRQRFNDALTTLFIGYATLVYYGAPAPALRKDLMPKIWRLYRASRQPVAQ